MFLVPVARRHADLARFLDSGFDRFFESAVSGPAALSPAIDVTADGDRWTVKVDLPGVAKEDVKVSIDGKLVTVEAQIRKEAERKDGERVLYRERTASAYARSFQLPEDVDQSNSAAKMENGVLTLTLAKRRPVSASQLTIS